MTPKRNPRGLAWTRQARETPAAMATIERINSSSSLLAGMTLSARRPPWAVGPSQKSAKENREQATQCHHNKSPRTWGAVSHLLQAQAGTVVWVWQLRTSPPT